MIKYFNDVLCPWCWGEEKVLRALDYTFPTLKWDYRMGSLIENYEDFLPPNFQNLNSVEMGNKILYDMYRAAATITKFPYYSSIPHLFSEQNKSSFPLNIYAIALRKSNEKKLGAYLRKVREATIYEDRDLYSMDVQKKILSDLQLDRLSFEENIFMAQEEFLEDRIECFDNRIKNYPVFLWEGQGRRKILRGYQTYETLCSFLKETEGWMPIEVPQTVEEVKKFLGQYEHVLKEEAEILFSKELLHNLIEEGQIVEKEVCGGCLLEFQ